MRLGTLSAANCTDPLTGDVVICPPGTGCDPAGSGQCVGQGTATTVCPVGQNLTAIGETCQCPAGYEYDADVNQCVVGSVGVFSTSPGSSPLVATTSSVIAPSTMDFIWLIAAGVAAWLIFGKGMHQ